MKITLQIEVQTDDYSTPLFEDVERALRAHISHTPIVWRDASLGREVGADIDVLEVRQG